MSLVTNVTSGDNAYDINRNVQFGQYWLPATEKWEATNVIAVITVTFDWMGRTRTNIHTVPVWGITNRYNLRMVWDPIPNAVAAKDGGR
ncbi:MAG: hypothetical protein IT581_06560 [Verrucomicrobiales bacterium]|nr:hypothetical protein [Verrucomicrobiales bacterium]